MKYNFPKLDICLKHNLSCIYQGMEEFWILQSNQTTKQESFYFDSISRKWILCSIRRYENSLLKVEEKYNEKGDMTCMDIYEYSKNQIKGQLSDSRIIWNFNDDNYLISENRSYEDAGDSNWIFTLDNRNNLSRLNEYEINKEKNLTKSIFNLNYNVKTIKEIKLENRKLETIDFENLKSTLYFDERDRVIRRISNYNRETITDYISDKNNKTYLKDKKGKLNLVYEYLEKEENNKIEKNWRNYGNNTRDTKEIST